jgi:phosphate:Na+ symporter
MGATLTLVNLAGAVALLLWGLHMVQTGIQRAFGAGLRRILATMLGGRLKAFLCGMGVTAVLQSSTATGLMVASFAGAGLVALEPALAAMLGANVGTTLIVQVLAFDVTGVASLAVLIGVVAFRRGQQTRTRDLGRVGIGLGLMLMALHTLLDLVTPYEDVPSLRLLLGTIATEPVVAVLVAAALTWAAHSSVATVLLFMSLAAKGVVPPEAAMALVLGANLGTAINPLLEATGTDGAAKRLPVGNLVNRIVGIVVALALLPQITHGLVTVLDDRAREVAMFHTLFNLVMALLFLPLLTPYARMLTNWVRGSPVAADPAQPRYLSEAERESPGVALGSAAREAMRLVDMLDGMLAEARTTLRQDDRKQGAELKAMHGTIERLGGAISAYVTAIDPDAMSVAERTRVAQVLGFATNMDQAGEVLARAMASLSARLRKRGLALAATDRGAVEACMARLEQNLRAAAALFMMPDPAAARALVAEKEAFRAIEAEATSRYTAGLREGARAGAEETLALDTVRELKRVNAHLVAGAAYPVLEAEGALLPTRLREDGEG